jgi:hypothetical protein
MKKTDVHAMAYRKSTHLAGIDIELMVAEKKSTVLTIKEAYYATDINVNGKVQAGYFIEFVEDVKPFCVNSGNRKIISNIVKVRKSINKLESGNLKNWIGEKIELYFEDNRSFSGVKTGGIGVKQISLIADVSDANGKKVLNTSKTLDELKANWLKLTEQERSLPTIVALKETLKTKLK